MLLGLLQTQAQVMEEWQEKESKYTYLSKRMSTLFDDGDMLAVIELYEQECLTEDKKQEKRAFKLLKDAQKVDIYALAAQAYLALNEGVKADAPLKKFFAIRYYDKKMEGYWPQMQTLRQSRYRVEPRLLAGVFLGVEQFTTVTQDVAENHIFRGVGNDDSLFSRNYQTHKLKLTFGVSGLWNFSRYMGLRFQVSAHQPVVNYQSVYYRYGRTISTRQTMENSNLYDFIGFGLGLPLRLTKRNWSVFVEPTARLWVSTSGQKEMSLFSNTVEHRASEPPVFGSALGAETRQYFLNITRQTNTITGQLGLATGLSYMFRAVQLELRAQYAYGWRNINNSDFRQVLSGEELIQGLYESPDTLFLDSFSITLGFNFIIKHQAYALKNLVH